MCLQGQEPWFPGLAHPSISTKGKEKWEFPNREWEGTWTWTRGGSLRPATGPLPVVRRNGGGGDGRRSWAYLPGGCRRLPVPGKVESAGTSSERALTCGQWAWGLGWTSSFQDQGDSGHSLFSQIPSAKLTAHTHPPAARRLQVSTLCPRHQGQTHRLLLPTGVCLFIFFFFFRYLEKS